MAAEIERKFLISEKNIPSYLLSIAEKFEIEQIYLKFPSPRNLSEIRLRKSNDTYFITEKISNGNQLLFRQEIEKPIPRAEYERLAAGRQGEIIKKTRYKIPGNKTGSAGRDIELDLYEGNLSGLIVAELEFPTVREAKKFAAPDWFGKDITEDKSYKNASLAQKGLPGIKGGKMWEITLTGGPCGGKSTFISSCKRSLEEKGFKVITISEVATEVRSSGIKSGEIPDLLFQTIVINKMLSNEENARLAAQFYREQGQDVIIFYDRGLFDNKAYCSPENWRRLLQDKGLNEENLRQRYDAVFNIVTTAYGAEDMWEKFSGNTPGRYERSVEQARETEDRIQMSWAGHHNLQIFRNDEFGWKGKEERLFNAVYSIIGVTPPMRTQRRYLVDISADLSAFAAENNCVVQEIEQTYLKSDNPKMERRVRKVRNGGDITYYYTEKEGAGLNRVVREYMPRDEKEYQLLLAQADPSKSTITKTRYSSAVDNQYLTLDVYSEEECLQLGGKAILELKGIEKTGQAFVPPQGLTVLKDVTDDARFANATLAAKIDNKVVGRFLERGLGGF
ncbi:MAG: AAA family ATPase [Clostridiales bacterium]|jgi:CYTH domain-containing protein|nr:AAA family ATPase [Clostridiales bacterium]